MSTSQEATSTLDAESDAQPINLAQKPAAISGRLFTEQSKSIYLVKPMTTLAPVHGVVVTSVVGVPLTNTPPPAHTASTTNQQPVGPSVAPPMAMAVPISMTRLQGAVRPGTPIALAPRVVPTVPSIPYGNLSVPVTQVTTLHVPKGPAAVASLSVPRAAAAQPAASGRPSTPVSITSTSINVTKPVRPTIATVRPSGLIVGSSSGLTGTWLPVSASNLSSTTSQPVSVATASSVRAAPPHAKSSTVVKPIPVPTSVSTGQPRAMPPRSAIMTVNPRTPLSGNLSIPRPGTDVRTGQPGSVRPITSVSSSTIIQVGDKQFAKSGSTLVTTSAAAVNRPFGGILQQPARPASSTAIQNNPGIATLPGRLTVSTVVSATGGSHGGLKPANPSNTKAALPQISVSAVSSKPFHVASTVPTRPVTVVTTTSSNTAIANRPLIISGASNATSVLPVAKVLPQPVLAASGTIKAVDLSTSSAAAAAVSAANAPPSLAESQSSNLTIISGASQPMSTAAGLPPGIYLHKAPHTASQGDKVTGTGTGTGTFPATTIYYESAERTSFHSFLSSSGTLLQQPTSTSSRNSATAAQSDLLLSVSSQPGTLSSIQSVTSKVGSSPRPSILRKRDHDGTPLKAQKNLSAALASFTSSSATLIGAIPSTPSAISPPTELTIHGESSRSSTGSTTLSASSSPGIPADMDDSNPPPTIVSSTASLTGLSSIQVKPEPLEANVTRMTSLSVPQGPPVEMSPRKKPRKQQFRLGQELQEVRSSDDELKQQLLLSKPDFIKREPPPAPKEPKDTMTVFKRPRASLLSTCKQTWKSRNNHFVRNSDVKLKDERRPTVTDLANQKQVMQKVNGWKVYHLSAQIEEMARLENEAHQRLSVLLDLMENLGAAGGSDKDLTRVHELIKGNLQRSKVIQDQLQESKTQVLKVFEHKPRVEEIIHRYMFKRLPKKREKS